MLTYDLDRMTEARKRAIIRREGVDISGAMARAKPVVDDVRLRGDRALRMYARRFDSFNGGTLTVSEDDIRLSRGKISQELLRAMLTCKRRIETYHRRQRIEPFEFVDTTGRLGQKVVPLERVGVYVPGGSADYVSTVLMCCVPAKIAGVEEISICTPGRNGKVPESILAAADICGVSEVHPVGGAHAVSAMAYGTRSIRRVRKIVGPGGAYVTAAKLLVRNDCEIDFLAGPSEVLVIADAKADPELLASDMLAQLEHDPLTRALLVTDSEETLRRTRDELRGQIASASRNDIAAKAALKGAVFLRAGSLESALRFSNEYAPEHLLIDTVNPKKIMGGVKNAGSVFLGRYSSVAFGDYCSGTNHVLPTMGAAAMKSALSVYDFMKVIPYQEISRQGAAELSAVVGTMARSEGLPAHADAAALRGRKVKR